MRSFHIRESGRGEERILLRYRYEALRAGKQFFPSRKRKKRSKFCHSEMGLQRHSREESQKLVSCRDSSQAGARGKAQNDRPAFSSQILRKSVKKERHFFAMLRSTMPVKDSRAKACRMTEPIFTRENKCTAGASPRPTGLYNNYDCIQFVTV